MNKKKVSRLHEIALQIINGRFAGLDLQTEDAADDLYYQMLLVLNLLGEEIQERQRAKSAYDQIFDDMPMGILILDEQEKIDKANKVVGRMLHTEQTELEGKHIDEVLNGQFAYYSNSIHGLSEGNSFSFPLNLAVKTRHFVYYVTALKNAQKRVVLLIEDSHRILDKSENISKLLFNINLNAQALKSSFTYQLNQINKQLQELKKGGNNSSNLETQLEIVIADVRSALIRSANFQINGHASGFRDQSSIDIRDEIASIGEEIKRKLRVSTPIVFVLRTGTRISLELYHFRILLSAILTECIQNTLPVKRNSQVEIDLFVGDTVLNINLNVSGNGLTRKTTRHYNTILSEANSFMEGADHWLYGAATSLRALNGTCKFNAILGIGMRVELHLQGFSHIDPPDIAPKDTDDTYM